jgi:LuxR family maltose regulon positive regulatory protein
MGSAPSPMTSSLPFITKLIVPKRKGSVLRRQRLLDFMHEYLDRKLILVSASAGYGKTTLLVDFAQDTEFPVCWYTLDAGDRDPQVFLEYLLASLQRRFPNFGGRTGALLQDPGRGRDLEAIVGTLVTEIQRDIAQYFVIALDDYHLVDESAPINLVLDLLLTYLPDNAHIILASRTLPTQLTLTKLTARLQATGLGVNDLRFHADEIRALMQQNYGLEITERVAERLAEQSEGWIAGIVLTTPTLWRGLFEDWVKARGSGSQLFEYLATEVFAQQPKPLQRFLLATSVLEPMNAALCNGLLGITDAGEQLRTLEARNLFITRVEGQEWYRYHHLFREFLQTRLRRADPTQLRDWQRRAAELFERLGYQNEAVEHWIEGEDFERAARLIETCADLLYDQGRWTTLAQWIDALPASVLEANPALLLRRGKIYAETGDLPQAQITLERAQRQFENRGEGARAAGALIEQAVVARNQGQSRVCLEKCQVALARLEARDFGLNALAHRVIGTALITQGDFTSAISQLEQALSLYHLANDRYNAAMTEHDLGVACRALGAGAKANGHFQNALAHWRELGNAADLANTLNSIAVGHYYRGDLDQARTVLEQARHEANKVGSLRIEAYALASLGDVYRDGGEPELALQTLAEAYRIAEKIREGFLITYVRAAMATLYRLNNDLRTAEQMARSAADAAQMHQSDYELGLAQTALGAVRLEQGAPEEATVYLNHALELFERRQARRDSARVHYFLAQMYFGQKRFEETHRELEALVELGQALDEDSFVLTEGARSLPLVRFALADQKENAYFRRILQKVTWRGSKQAPRASVDLVESPWPRLQIFTLGAARVLRDGQAIDKIAWQSAPAKELFFYFAIHPRAWRKEEVIASLWEDMPVAKANDVFHSSIYRIRRALFPDCLVYHDGLYQLNGEAERWIDVDEFERLIGEAERAADPSVAADLMRRGLELYQGDLLQEFYSDWCQSRREGLREKYLGALRGLAQHHARGGEYEPAIELCRSALKKDNLREEIYRELMALYFQMGDRTAAIQTYRRCAQVLEDELGVTPMSETLALYDRIVDEPRP